MVDARIQHASHAFQHFDPSVSKMLARVLRPDVIQERFNLRRGDVAEEAAVRMLMGVLCCSSIYVSLPSSPLLTFYSATKPAWA